MYKLMHLTVRSDISSSFWTVSNTTGGSTSSATADKWAARAEAQRRWHWNPEVHAAKAPARCCCREDLEVCAARARAYRRHQEDLAVHATEAKAYHRHYWDDPGVHAAKAEAMCHRWEGPYLSRCWGTRVELRSNFALKSIVTVVFLLAVIWSQKENMWHL